MRELRKAIAAKPIGNFKALKGLYISAEKKSRVRLSKMHNRVFKYRA
jgi:hypothetical protein